MENASTYWCKPSKPSMVFVCKKFIMQIQAQRALTALFGHGGVTAQILSYTPNTGSWKQCEYDCDAPEGELTVMIEVFRHGVRQKDIPAVLKMCRDYQHTPDCNWPHFAKQMLLFTRG